MLTVLAKITKNKINTSLSDNLLPLLGSPLQALLVSFSLLNLAVGAGIA
jgi:hypothetical protein